MPDETEVEIADKVARLLLILDEYATGIDSDYEHLRQPAIFRCCGNRYTGLACCKPPALRRINVTQQDELIATRFSTLLRTENRSLPVLVIPSTVAIERSSNQARMSPVLPLHSSPENLRI